VTVAARLQTAGYHTGLIGEWTLGARPWTQGFDEFAGFISDSEARNYFPSYLWRYAPKSIFNETNHTLTDFADKEMIYPNTGGQQGKYLPELLAGAMCNFVSGNQPVPFNHYKPFFLLVNLPAPRSASVGMDVFPVPSDAPFSNEKWPAAAKNRAAVITRLDGSIGQLFEQLQQLNLTNNVAIFFSSSAAPEKFAGTNLDFLQPNGKAMDGKNSSAPLPMIVWWPDAVRAKQTSAFKWTSADFAPTALDIAFAPRVKDLGGMSILPVLQGKGGPTVDKPSRQQMP
jgi:arylsulfatase A-like enzyme